MSAKLVWALILLAGAVASAETLGSIADIEEFPSLAQVEFKVGVSWVLQCAGSILTNRHVLSSATCFSGILTDRRIRVGSNYRGRSGEVVYAEKADLNSNFGLLGHDADIAVVHLSSYLTLGATVQQAAILGQGIELPLGLNLQHAGWGTTAEGGHESSENLYSLEVSVKDNEDCLVQYIGEQTVTENMICVGLGTTRGRDFDSADRGGPLYYENTLVGILVFGETSNDEYPIIATNVGSYTEWIISAAA